VQEGSSILLALKEGERGCRGGHPHRGVEVGVNEVAGRVTPACGIEVEKMRLQETKPVRGVETVVNGSAGGVIYHCDVEIRVNEVASLLLASQ